MSDDNNTDYINDCNELTKLLLGFIQYAKFDQTIRHLLLHDRNTITEWINHEDLQQAIKPFMELYFRQ